MCIYIYIYTYIHTHTNTHTHTHTCTSTHTHTQTTIKQLLLGWFVKQTNKCIKLRHVSLTIIWMMSTWYVHSILMSKCWHLVTASCIIAVNQTQNYHPLKKQQHACWPTTQQTYLFLLTVHCKKCQTLKLFLVFNSPTSETSLIYCDL